MRSRRATERPQEWTRGNELRLLENGEEYYPRLFESITTARAEILFETFIWQEDQIGVEFARLLAAAARRGVAVRVTVDGYGTPGFSEPFLAELNAAGVQLLSFDPQPTLFRVRTNLFCRLHQKIAVIDGKRAFVGGINISDDHLLASGGESKQDFAVEVTGPVVDQIRDYVHDRVVLNDGPWWRTWRYWLRRFPEAVHDPDEQAQVLFATRDNSEHPTDIETLYRIAIRNASREITIANAYFFPGFRFVRDLLNARERGVRVRLIVQGNPDRPVMIGLASVLLDELAAAGVEVYQFTDRPLHAKVAVVDDHWATVGSSNLDPTSLGLNFEANLFILDREFNETLRNRLDEIIAASCRDFADGPVRASWLRRLIAALSYHLTRHMATWGRHALRRGQYLRPI